MEYDYTDFEDAIDSFDDWLDRAGEVSEDEAFALLDEVNTILAKHELSIDEDDIETIKSDLGDLEDGVVSTYTTPFKVQDGYSDVDLSILVIRSGDLYTLDVDLIFPWADDEDDIDLE